MKVFIEDEVEEEGEKRWTQNKEVADKEEAIREKDTKKKQRVHICYHDEENPKSCKVEAL